VFLAGDIWAAEGDSGAVVRIDPESAQVRATIPVRSSAPPPDAGRDPAALAASDNMLWVLSGDGWSVAGIDPRSNQVTRSFLLSHQADDIAAAAGSLWLTSPASNVLDRVDPANGTLQASIAVQQPTGLAATNASVWVGSATRVLRIDTQRDRVADRLDLGGQVFALAADGENVWAAEGQEPSVSWITRG
jgi:streptogramin lyase